MDKHLKNDRNFQVLPQRLFIFVNFYVQIETTINKTLNKSIESVRLTIEMKRRLAPLEKKFEENEKVLVVAETEVNEAVNISSKSKTVSI